MANDVRKVTELKDFADVLTEIGGGWKTKFVYLNTVGIRGTGEKVDMGRFSTDLDADTGLDQGVSDTLHGFAAGGQTRKNKFPYAGVVKAARYLVNWQSARKHKENYDNFVTQSNKLSAKYAAQALERQGLPLTQDALDSVQIKSRNQRDYENQEAGNTDAKTSNQRKDYRRFVDYGKGGMYIRPNDNDRLVIPQNMKTVTSLGTDYFLIDSNGNIAGGKPVSKATIQQIFSPKSPKDSSKARALAALGANEEEIQNYMKEFLDLGWDEHDYMGDQIIYAVASSTDNMHNGGITKVIFYNRDLISNIVNSKSSLLIDPQQFLAIAKEEIKKVYGITIECRRLFNEIIHECFKPKKQVRLTESELKQVVKEAAMKIVKNLIVIKDDVK